MSPTPRAAYLLAAIALTPLLITPQLSVLLALGLLAAWVVDARAVRNPPRVERTLPHLLSRGVPSPVVVAAATDGHPVRVRQPTPADLALETTEASDKLETTIVATRRGRHTVPAPATRTVGPLGLAAWYHRPGDEAEVLVYPDVVAARRLAAAVSEGRFRHAGRLRYGPLGLGTEFESIRDYVPDDDVRQVNWLATARFGRPMSNQHRIEQDRDLICLVDTGRLMMAPLGDQTRLDAAVDVVAAIAMVADGLGDRCGTIAFDTAVRRRLRPRRKGGNAVLRAIFDLEPTLHDSDYELAFRSVGSLKRAFVLVLTDLVEESAARPLVDAVPLLARRHFVAVASAKDPDLEALLNTVPQHPRDVYAASVALEVLGARERAAVALRRAGAVVVEAAPGALAAACVSAYLRGKRQARI